MLARTIPYGRWTTYGTLASAIPGSTGRAVANALKALPFDWHRLRNANGAVVVGDHQEADAAEVADAALRAEGVEVVDGRADLGAYWVPPGGTPQTLRPRG